MFKKIVFSVLLFSTLQAFSQQTATIVGTLTDQAFDQEPLLFAAVKIKETGKITQTNFHGNFEFKNVAPGTYTLEFSFVGYEAEELVVVVNTEQTSRIKQQLKQKTFSYEPSENLNSEALKTVETTPITSLNK